MAKSSSNTNHDWLSLVHLSGLLISESILQEHFSGGPEPVETYPYRRLKREWERFRLGREKKDQAALTKWVNFILEQLLEIPSIRWQKHTEISNRFTLELLEYRQTLRPSRLLLDEDDNALLFVYITPASQRLDKPETATGKWRTSPLTKFDRLLRELKVPLGLLTNGEDFCLLHAPSGLTTSSISWTAMSWMDEKSTIDAFFTLLNRERFFGEEKKLLLKLAENSQKRQTDVTDQLGEQVRSALELFIRAIDVADKSVSGELLRELSEEDIYETSLTLMMRLVFLLYAEENLLLPHGEMLYDNAYGITHLWFELETKRRVDAEQFKNTYDAWDRLLATFRLIYYGCPHPDLILRAYGGRLFDPERFPALEDERLKIPNETIYQIVRKLTFARAKMGRNYIQQRVSYRTLDIEQIGSVYEGLMEYRVKRADETMVPFRGKNHSIRPLAEFVEMDDEELISYLINVTSMSKMRIKKALAKGVEKTDEMQTTQDAVLVTLDERSDPEKQLERFEELVYTDRVLYAGDRYLVREGTARKGSGSYYTPKQLTSFLVEQALEPQCHEGDYKERVIKKPKEILALKVCDPAMGSGAFLVQACRYLSERLVESWDYLQSQDPEAILTMPYGKKSTGELEELIIPEEREEQIVWAKRFVVENCIYGVDLNPLAVDLAKMSLWLSTLSKDRPFTFLDHRLRCGNSLIGTEFSRLDSIPSEPLWKKDRLKNKKLLEKLPKMPLTKANVEAMIENIITGRRDLAKHERSIIDVEYKEKLMKDIEAEGTDYAKIKKLCDLWCAVWFWPNEVKEGARKKGTTSLADFGMDVEIGKFEEEELAPPHTEKYHKIIKYLAGEVGDTDNGEFEEILRLSKEAADIQRFFHWELEFPEIFRYKEGGEKENPGFDAVVGNPPWEIVKPNSNEFYSQFDPNFRSYKKQQAITVMEILQEDTAINQKWEYYCQVIKQQSIFFRKSTSYPHMGSGDINLYKLFLERDFHLTRSYGFSSLIIPSGFYTDKGCTELRKLLILGGNLRFMYCFSNEKFIFLGTHHAFKFVLINMKKDGNINEFHTTFRIDPRVALYREKIVPHLSKPMNLLTLNSMIIHKFSPDTLSIMEFKTQRDIDICSKIYGEWPLLGEQLEGTWNVKFTTEFHMTNDSHLFHTREKLEKMDATEEDLLWWKKNKGGNMVWWLPLYEGKMIKHLDPYFSKPQYWIRKKELSKVEKFKIGIRSVGGSTNERTLYCTVIPSPTPCGNSLIVTSNLIVGRDIVFISSILSSFVIDFIMRKKVSTNLNMFYLYQLPVIRQIQDGLVLNLLLDKTVKLLRIKKDYSILWDDVKNTEKNGNGTDSESSVESGALGWTKDGRDIGDRAQLRAEIDALVAHLYRLTEDEFSYILDTFPVLKKNEEAAFREFRSKRMCLEEYRRFTPIIEEERRKNPKTFEILDYKKTRNP